MSARAAVIWRLTELEDLLPGSLTRLSARSPSPSACVPLHSVAYEMAVGFPRVNEGMGAGGCARSTQATKMEATVSFISRLRSNIASLLPYSIWYADHPWYNMGGDNRSVWIPGAQTTGAILESGYHAALESFIIFSYFQQSAFALRLWLPPLYWFFPILVLDILKLYSEASLLYFPGEEEKTQIFLDCRFCSSFHSVPKAESPEGEAHKHLYFPTSPVHNNLTCTPTSLM